jgi:transposase
MMMYAGLDVTDKTTPICVFDSDGAILRPDIVASNPDVLAKWLGRHCLDIEQVVLEAGPL